MTTAQLAPTAPVGLLMWFVASRPKTLGASVVPVAVGTALAHTHGGVRVPVALAALLGALFIQVGTNLANDFHDFKRGADNKDRLGPARVTAQGWLPPRTVLLAALACFAASLLMGVYLVMAAGWPLLVVGLVSVVCGYLYTGGPWPLGYHGLGDVFVLVFFGPVAVLATCYAQTGQLPPEGWAAGLGVGAMANTLLVVNNLRDIPTDARVGKRTLAVRLGPAGTRVQYVALLVVAYSVVVWMAWRMPLASVLLAAASAALVPSAVRQVLTSNGQELNAALAASARIHMAYGSLLVVGLLL